ncbi:MAG: 50S ribosomal protein L35ae [Nanoarchaeota archaeon]
MNGVVIHFRRSKRRTTGNQMIIQPEKSSTVDAAKALVGKKVSWKSPAGKVLAGKVSAPHGCKGCVRALFETGMPGQAIGQKVEIQ